MSIICNKGNFSHTKQLFQSNKILNVYKLNILNVATFMYNVNQKTAPNIFLSRFQKPSHSYPTRFSNVTTYNQSTKLKRVNTQFELEGHPCIWNRFLSSEEKEITTMHKFKAIIKSRLLFLENELAFLKRELSLFIRVCGNLLHLQF